MRLRDLPSLPSVVNSGRTRSSYPNHDLQSRIFFKRVGLEHLAVGCPTKNSHIYFSIKCEMSYSTMERNEAKILGIHKNIKFLLDIVAKFARHESENRCEKSETGYYST